MRDQERWSEEQLLELLPAFLDGELDPAQQEQVEALLERSEEARRRLKELARLINALDETITTPSVPEGFTPQVMERVRQRQAQRGWRARFARWPVGVWLRWAAEGTALVGLLLLLLVHPWNPSVSPSEVQVLVPPQFLCASRAAVRVVARRHDTGEPLAQAPVYLSLHGSGRHATLLTGRTNGRGTLDASFTLPPDFDEGSYLLTVEARTRYGTERVTQPVQLRRAYRILLTTDKPVYQPGQTIHLRTLTFEVGTQRPATERQVIFEVEDPRGNKVFKSTQRVSQFGVAAADFTLGQDILLGPYRVRATVEGRSSERTVEVKRYALPKFKVEVRPERSFYLPGEEVRGTVRAAYFFGKPVARAKVWVELATFDTDWSPFAKIEGRTDAEGTFTFACRLPDTVYGQPVAQGLGSLRVAATVVDAAAHAETASRFLPVSAQPLLLDVLPESGTLVPGVENLVYLLASYPDGSPAQVELTITSAQPHVVPVAAARLHTDATGLAVWRVVPPAERLTLRFVARDRQGNRTEEVHTLTVTNPLQALLLRPDRAFYRAGETLHLLLLAPGRTTGTAYLDFVREGQTVHTASTTLTNGQGRLSFDLPPDLFGALELRAYLLSEGGLVRDTRRVVVESPRDLQVTVEADRAVYRPGEEARLRFEVKNAAQPRPAALGVDVVDESVFALREWQPRMEKLYFELEEELLTPRAEVHRVSLPKLLQPGEEARVKPELGCAALAAYDPGWDFGLRMVSSYQAKMERAQVRQERFFATLRVIGWALLLLTMWGGFSWAALRAGGIRRQDNTRWQYWGKFLGMAVILGGSTFSVGTWLAQGLWWWSEWAVLLMAASGCWVLLTVILRLIRVRRRAWLVLLALLPLLTVFLPPVFLRVREKARRGPPQAELLQAMPAAGEMGAPGMAMIEGVEEEKALAPTARPPERPAAPPRLRRFFPETLYSNPNLLTDEQGKAELRLSLADSITTWRLSALASSAAGELGAATYSLRVFQDFFVDLDLPVALTQGDEVSLPLALYNYLPEPQTVRLKLVPSPASAAWCTLLGPAEREVRLQPNEVRVVYFPLRAERVGTHTLTVWAYGSRMSDALERQVEVLPNGQEFVLTRNGRLREDLTETLTLPADAIAGASRLQIKIYPGPLSPIVEGLEGLLQMPSGCFEQTSSSTYPNVLLLDYLKRTGQLTPEVQAKAEHYINVGYQRLLTFEVEGGGFEWFGHPPANQLLTAYGLLEFTDMARVHPVDAALIERTRGWLLSKQEAERGVWVPEEQYLHDWGELASSELLTTAYITWALVSSGHADEPGVQRGLNYLRTHLREANDHYTLALCANALAAANPRDPAAQEALQRLVNLRRREEGQAPWGAHYRTVTYSHGSAADLEATALALHALLLGDSSEHEVIQQALDYLLARRSASGTWGSTQATILALKTLLLAQEKGSPKAVKATVRVEVNGTAVETLELRPEDADVVRIVDAREHLRLGTNRVTLHFSGQGTVLYQIVGTYYRPWANLPSPPQTRLDLSVAYDKTRLRRHDTLTCEVTLRNRQAETLTMVLVDVGVPPGFTVQAEDLQRLVQAGVVQRYELTGRQVILYLAELRPGRPLRLRYTLKARYPLRVQTPPSRAYEYYNPTEEALTAPVRLRVS